MKKIALVTGGTRGIGRAISINLSQAGFEVIANYHNDSKMAEEFTKTYGIRTMKWDVANFNECSKNINDIQAEYDAPILVLINNAGIIRDSMLHKMEDEAWQKVIDVNLSSCFNMCRLVINEMRNHGFGRIINISSINGITGQVGQVNYSAAKAGMIGLTKALAKEVASKGITVNAVAPGYILTDMVKSIDADIAKKIAETIPVKRFGMPEEIANAVSFLANENSGFITGETISVNGGQHM